MEVHAPHHPLNNWKDFFIHLATITVGLLIALALEAGAEAVHHHHLVVEARENIRREIEGNQKEATNNVGYVRQDSERMVTNMHTVDALRQNPHALDHAHMSFLFSWSSFNDSAWRSARDTGALSYMPVDEVQHYADAYNQQSIVNDQAVTIFTHQAQIAAPLLLADDGDLEPAEARKLALDCAVTHMQLDTLGQLIDALKTNYGETLKK